MTEGHILTKCRFHR